MRINDLIATGMANSMADVMSGLPHKAITAGTVQTQAGATEITTDYTSVTVGVANDGVRLPANTRRGDMFFIRNVSANAGRLYPATGGTLNGGSVNAHITLTANRTFLVIMISDKDGFVVVGSA